jgi:nickel-dependent lactate racemase
LRQIIREKSPRRTAIIVNDMTRSTPSQLLLPLFLEALHAENIPPEAITIVIACGTHRPMTLTEVEGILGHEVATRYHIENHDCDSSDLECLGSLPTGNELWVNHTVATADLRLAIGEILFHYYAGFAGGRKSLLPGTTGRHTTMRNHALMLQPGSGIGRLADNPVHHEMLAALDLCPLHFIINVILDHHKRMIHAVAGDPVAAWQEGVREFSRWNSVPIPHPVEVVLASAGGYPKDINLYQAHKALEMAAAAVKENGTLVLFADCEEGLGHPVFAETATQGLSYDELRDNLQKTFRFGVHKLFYLARLARRVRLVLFSSLDEATTERIFCTKGSDPSRLWQSFTDTYGENWQAYVIPQAGMVLPIPPGLPVLPTSPVSPIPPRPEPSASHPTHR